MHTGILIGPAARKPFFSLEGQKNRPEDLLIGVVVIVEQAQSSFLRAGIKAIG